VRKIGLAISPFSLPGEIVLIGVGGAALDAVTASPSPERLPLFADLNGLVKII
jgi:hypothetical protein